MARPKTAAILDATDDAETGSPAEKLISAIGAACLESAQARAAGEHAMMQLYTTCTTLNDLLPHLDESSELAQRIKALIDGI